MAREFKTEDGKAYTIRLAGRSGEALESFWAGKATSRDTVSALRGLPSSSPACWMCDGAGYVEVGGNCLHGVTRDHSRCTDACVRREVCANCYGRK